MAGVGFVVLVLAATAWLSRPLWQPAPPAPSPDQGTASAAAEETADTEVKPRPVAPRGRLVDVDGPRKPPAAEASPETAAPAADPEAVERWSLLYDRLMRPLATALDDIDYNGITQNRCVELQRTFRKVLSEIETCPDPEVESFLEPAYTNLHEVAAACRGEDEVLWSTSLLETKRLVYRAQILLDERYHYLGISELELDSAIGVQRSPESISGRYLLDKEEQEWNAGFEPLGDGSESNDKDIEEELFGRMGDG